MKLRIATAGDAAELAALHNEVRQRLTMLHGKGHRSYGSSERGVLFSMTRARVYVVRDRGRLVATFTLSTRKPWAIDTSYFSESQRPLYLTGMAVSPRRQGRGIGRVCLEEARRIAAEWPADSIRLDSYNAAAGADGFYAKCGFTEVGRAAYKGTPLVYFDLRI